MTRGEKDRRAAIRRWESRVQVGRPPARVSAQLLVQQGHRARAVDPVTRERMLVPRSIRKGRGVYLPEDEVPSSTHPGPP